MTTKSTWKCEGANNKKIAIILASLYSLLVDNDLKLSFTLHTKSHLAMLAVNNWLTFYGSMSLSHDKIESNKLINDASPYQAQSFISGI